MTGKLTLSIISGTLIIISGILSDVPPKITGISIFTITGLLLAIIPITMLLVQKFSSQQ